MLLAVEIPIFSNLTGVTPEKLRHATISSLRSLLATSDTPLIICIGRNEQARSREGF